MSKNNSVIRNIPVKACILCSEPNPTSEEHIFPAWIFRALKKSNIPHFKYANFANLSRNGSLLSLAQVDADDATSPILCDPCNGKFSGDIQNKVSSILSPFVCGRWNELNPEQIKMLVRWYTCFLFVREMLHDQHETHTQQERVDFRRKGIIPKSLNIWIAPLFSPHQSTNHRPLILTEDHSKIHFSVHAIGYLLLVSYGANPEGPWGKESDSYSRLNKLMGDLRFVKIRDFDRKKKVYFPKTKPGYFSFTNVLNFTDVLERTAQNEVNYAPILDCYPHKFELRW